MTWPCSRKAMGEARFRGQREAAASGAWRCYCCCCSCCSRQTCLACWSAKHALFSSFWDRPDIGQGKTHLVSVEPFLSDLRIFPSRLLISVPFLAFSGSPGFAGSTPFPSSSINSSRMGRGPGAAPHEPAVSSLSPFPCRLFSVREQPRLGRQATWLDGTYRTSFTF